MNSTYSRDAGSTSYNGTASERLQLEVAKLKLEIQKLGIEKEYFANRMAQESELFELQRRNLQCQLDKCERSG